MSILDMYKKQFESLQIEFAKEVEREGIKNTLQRNELWAAKYQSKFDNLMAKTEAIRQYNKSQLGKLTIKK